MTYILFQKPIRNRGPADYETKSFVEDLNHHSVVHHGEFKKLDQYPQTPGERIYYTTPVQAPIEAVSIWNKIFGYAIETFLNSKI